MRELIREQVPGLARRVWLWGPVTALGLGSVVPLVAWSRTTSSPASLVFVGFWSWMLPLLVLAGWLHVERGRRSLAIALAAATTLAAWPVGAYLETARARYDVYCDEEGTCEGATFPRLLARGGPLAIGTEGEGAECSIPDEWIRESVRVRMDSILLCSLDLPPSH